MGAVFRVLITSLLIGDVAGTMGANKVVQKSKEAKMKAAMAGGRSKKKKWSKGKVKEKLANLAMKAMMSMKASSKAMKAMKASSKCKGRTKELMPRVTASE